MLNRIVIQGRLVADPEMRKTPAGASVAFFRIACDRDFKNKDGEKETDFVSITAWRNTADFVSKYCTKGTLVTIDGRLQMHNYADKDGNKRTAAEVVTENVYFSESKKNSGDATEESPEEDAKPAETVTGDSDSEELPF